MVLILWLATVIVLFWKLQFQYETQWFTFDGSTLGIPASPKIGHQLVVHFIDPECPCTRFSKPHIEALEETFKDLNITFKSVNPGLAPVNQMGLSAVPASPAVAVWNEAGELSYFGPYSKGALCGEGEDLLRPVLRQEIRGQLTHQEAIGCFCQWPIPV